ncbi:hypothetical protein PGT21_021128 [Puccinia graminis f. sp. tritici]|uniref:Uncharacterized protein n=1 Tax=Puccinia graminis f. sp. tritici TaxID=56615 RepID=A0A5B0PLM9_PUCGR|nr:hypothetical protein PGT21_021128 [Puccinia graminis f. sp. tritici]
MKYKSNRPRTGLNCQPLDSSHPGLVEVTVERANQLRHGDDDVTAPIQDSILHLYCEYLFVDLINQEEAEEVIRKFSVVFIWRWCYTVLEISSQSFKLWGNSFNTRLSTRVFFFHNELCSPSFSFSQSHTAHHHHLHSGQSA